MLSQSGTWPIGSDIKNCNVRNILEYLYAKCMFTYIQLDVFKRVKVVPVGYFVHEDTCRNYAFSDQWSKVLSQSGTWPYDIRNVSFRNILEYLYAKCVFICLQLDVFKRVRVVGVFFS